MAQPTPYVRDYDFEGFQSGHPQTPLPGDKVNDEFDLLDGVIDQILARIALLQDDDLVLKRGSVGLDQLSDELSLGFEPPTLWATATDYVVRNTVFANNNFYRCLISHTSGTFSTDLADGNWELVADFTGATTAAEAAQTAAEAAQAASEAAQTAAEAAQSAAVTSAANASTSAGSAATSSSSASGFAGDALASATASAAARDAALAAEAGAEAVLVETEALLTATGAVLTATEAVLVETEAVAATVAGYGPSFKTPALMLADVTFTALTAGTIVTAGPHRYEVVTSGEDLTTAGGLKLQLLRGAEGRFAISGLGVATGANVHTRLQALLNRLRSAGNRESIVIDGWWTIDAPLRSAPWVWWYGSGLGMLRATGTYGNVRFQVTAHDTIPDGVEQNSPMIWMAESPVQPAVLAGDPTLQARIGSSDGTTARRDNAYIDVSVTLDCNSIAEVGLFTDNIQNSKFECVILDALNYGVQDYFYGWGNEHLESVVSAGIIGKWLSFAGNGVHVGGKQIWGNPVQPSVAHILCEGDCNGMNIDMGFVEEGVTGVLLRRAVGPINISGVDFEIFSSYAIDIDGSTVSGTRPCGPVTVTNCFIETSGTNAVIRVNNGILNVEGCRIRNLAGQEWINTSGVSGTDPALLSAFEVIGADSVVNERNNWIQPSIGNRYSHGVVTETQGGSATIRRVVRDSPLSLTSIDENSVHSDPYARDLPTAKDVVESIVFDAGIEQVGARRSVTAELHEGGATVGVAGFVVDALQGASNLAVVPIANNTNDLGSNANRWKRLNVQTGVFVDGVQVVGAQQGVIGDASGGTEVSKINDILAVLRTHGLIAT